MMETISMSLIGLLAAILLTVLKMAASVEWDEYNGAGETLTSNITGINMGSFDGPDLTPATYPITKPGWSYDKWWKIDFGGTFNLVDNFKLWRSNSGGGDAGSDPLATGVLFQAETSSQATTDLTYVTPVNTDKGLSDIPYQEASALSVGPAAGLSGVGQAYYMHCQLEAQAGASTGDTPTYYLTFRYDEQ